MELLLRQPLQSDEDILFALAAAEAGLLFMEQVRQLSFLAFLMAPFVSWNCLAVAFIDCVSISLLFVLDIAIFRASRA